MDGRGKKMAYSCFASKKRKGERRLSGRSASKRFCREPKFSIERYITPLTTLWFRT